MNVVLWIVAVVLAMAFLVAGTAKLSQTQEKLIDSGMGYAEDFSPRALKTIGALEVSAAVGLVLPATLGFGTALVPLAATGLVLLMLGAAVTHARRGERQTMVVNAILAVLAAGVAWGRFGPYAF